MASLYTTSKRTRLFLLGFLLFAILLIGSDFIGNLITAPPDLVLDEANRFYLSPNRVFGEITKGEIPGIEYNPTAQFKLESIHSNFPDAAYVYSVEKPRASLLAVENAEAVVSKLGFDPNASVSADDIVYEWKKDFGTRLFIHDTVDRTWHMDTLFYENEAALARKDISDNLDDYIRVGGSVLNGLGFNTFGMSSAIIEARYVQLGLDGIFVDVENTKHEDADYVDINVYRNLPLADLKPKGELPEVENDSQIPPAFEGQVYTDDPRVGELSLIVSNDGRNLSEDIFRIFFKDYVYDQSNIGIYQVVTPDEAWDKVQQGQGSLVFLQPQGSNYYADFDNVNIRQFSADARKTEIAYWEPNDWTGYVYPIYVFRGVATMEDGRQASFIFFIDAIKRVND